ncbi:MAG: pentapeptide repeat-containing protein [Rivularia sp. (in: cyanobacteria)]
MTNNTSIKTILILAANPKTTSWLRLDEEIREIDNGLQAARKREQFRLITKLAVRQRDFYRAILEYQPQIIHFCGHGEGDDGIVLDSEIEQSVTMGTEALSRLFKLFAVRGLECVVLNACYSEVQAKAISQYIKYVVGMNKAIGDKAAINFAVAFYDALAAGEDIQFAYDLGCSQLVDLKEDSTPILKVTEIHPADIQFVAGDIPPNPYLGLSAFAEKDAAFFFGREKFTDELFDMAHQQNLVAVIGASGSGKSSVVFAGLIPKLREEGTWLIESLRPKSQPFDELALALVRQLEPNLNGVDKTIKVGKLEESLNKGEVKLHQVVSQILEDKPNKRFLLVVDQFEELYTQCQDKEQQQHFIDTLLLAINQRSITLVFTLRADFYSYVLSYRPFSDTLQEITFKPLGLMSREELLTAIEQPAKKLEVTLQTHLTERIFNDVGQEPGNLPLLEFALTQLWDKQKNDKLTHQAYDEIGGVKQALVKHTEEVYKKLSEAQKQQAQRIFLSLIRLGETTEDTRRVATREEIGNQNWDLVRFLAGSETRLLVTGRKDKSGEETVEVVHEALIREWTTFRKWVNENREKLIQKRKIELAAVEWKEKNKLNGYLLQGRKLEDAQLFQKKQNFSLALSDLASEFIHNSIKCRWNNRFRLIVFGLTPIVLLTIFLGFVGYREVRITHLRDVVRQGKGVVNNARFNALEQLVKLNASLKGINLSGVNLSGVNLSDGNLSGANLSGANLSNTDLKDANFSGANLFKVNLSGGNLSGANLKYANLKYANLRDADLGGAQLFNAQLFNADLSNADLSNAQLFNADLSNADLRDADLRYAYLGIANLNGVNLSGADLSNADLRDANLNGVKLHSAKLRDANLSYANLSSTDLSGVNLSGVNLSDANLSGANLSSTDLSGANLRAAYLDNAIFWVDHEARNITPEQIKRATNWEYAIYSPEFRKKLGLSPEEE